MKRILKTIWAKLSSGQKMNLIGSAFLIFSLLLKWYSDTDIFRSGDTYTGLNGPLYLVGFTLLALAAGNILLTVFMAMKVPFVKSLGEIRLGQWQMNFGFLAMYLLVLVNSVYFSPFFGLNILNKRSEVGVMVALGAVVMICIGGYLAYRKKFEVLEAAKASSGASAPVSAREKAQEPLAPSPVVEEEVGVAEEIAPVLEVPVVAYERVPASVNEPSPAPVAATANSATYFSERDPRGKTEFERTKIYENLKKTMLRDTLTPQQRKQEKLKETQGNAFSANFGKDKAVKQPATVGEAAADKGSVGAKKPQMYRLDL